MCLPLTTGFLQRKLNFFSDKYEHLLICRGMQAHDDPLRRDTRGDTRGDTWYRDTWVNNQADQWRQGDVYPQQQPQQYPQQPDQGHQTSSLKRRQQRQFRTPSPQM